MGAAQRAVVGGVVAMAVASMAAVGTAAAATAAEGMAVGVRASVTLAAVGPVAAVVRLGQQSGPGGVHQA